MIEPSVTVDVIYGSIELEQRRIVDGDTLVFQGRSIHRRIDGTVERVTEWESLSRITGPWQLYIGPTHDITSGSSHPPQ